MIEYLIKIQPHRALGIEGAAYVERVDEGGKDLAAWTEAGLSTILIVGPAGIGKSTELSRAARALGSSRRACVTRLDQHENVRQVSSERALLRIAGCVVQDAMDRVDFKPSNDLRRALAEGGMMKGATLTLREMSAVTGIDLTPSKQNWDPVTTLTVACREVAAASGKGRVTLLIDGLEKSPESTFQGLASDLGRLGVEVDLVVVVPWYVVYGQHTGEVLRPGEKYFFIHPQVVGDLGTEPAAAFLRQLLAKHFESVGGQAGLIEGVFATASPDAGILSMRGVFLKAMEMSGGIPRTYLQLLVDSAFRAKLRQSHVLAGQDLDDAVADHRDSFRRLLSHGDEEALNGADGNDGRDLDWGTKIRLLSHGILLECREGGRLVMRIHPIARGLFQ